MLPLRARISVRAGLGNLAAGLRPPATGHDNPHYFDDAACVRACVLAVAHPGDPRLAAELAEFDARYTQDGDGVHGARAMAAALALALVGADVDACVDGGAGRTPRGHRDRPQRPPRPEARPIRRQRGRARSPWSRSWSTRSSTTSTATASPPPRPSRSPSPWPPPPRGRIAEAVPAAACLSRVADSAPALAGALTGALGGGAAIPAPGGTPAAPSPAAPSPASPAPTSWNSPNCWKPRNRPPQEDDSRHDAQEQQDARTASARALEERITGALVGAAVGDALGGPVEGYTPEQILERHGGRVHGIVGPWNGDDWRTARPIAPYHKGDGHVTDDTLMTHALVRVYAAVRDHLDAYAIADHLVPDLMTNPRWIPELEAEALPLQRVFLAEKWLVARLHYGHIDPREAGVGNIVNCGAAMYMAPVGLVNAANPAAAYAEALDIAGAHQSSYGREAAAVFAAAVAAACAPGATPDSVIETCLVPGEGRHPGGDRGGVRSGLPPHGLRVGAAAAARGGGSVRHGRPRLPQSRRSAPVAPPASTRSRNSRSRWACCWSPGGDYRHAVLGSVNYGRDCDSIATMAGRWPERWAPGCRPTGSKTVAEASRLDLWAPADGP